MLVLYSVIQQPTEIGSIMETVIIIILLFVLSFMAFLIHNSRKKIHNLSSRINQLENENRFYEKDNNRLHAERENPNIELQKLSPDLKQSKFPVKTKPETIGNKEKSEPLMDMQSGGSDDEPPPSVVWPVEVLGSEFPPEISEDENILFLPFPDRENTFYVPDGTKIPTQDSFYKMINSQLTLYENIRPDIMQMAMDFEENHIRRVCEIRNRKENFHTRLKVFELGEVYKDQDDIIVRKKMIVEYV